MHNSTCYALSRLMSRQQGCQNSSQRCANHSNNSQNLNENGLNPMHRDFQNTEQLSLPSTLTEPTVFQINFQVFVRARSWPYRNSQILFYSDFLNCSSGIHKYYFRNCRNFLSTEVLRIKIFYVFFWKIQKTWQILGKSWVDYGCSVFASE